MTFDEILALTHQHMVEPPLFLPLAARCFGIMGTEVPRRTAIAFKQRMAERLRDAGAGLERHFAELNPGGGVPLLRHSYALILGLWQMSSTRPVELPEAIRERARARCSAFDYPDELDRGAARAVARGDRRRRARHEAQGKAS